MKRSVRDMPPDRLARHPGRTPAWRAPDRAQDTADPEMMPAPDITASGALQPDAPRGGLLNPFEFRVVI